MGFSDDLIAVLTLACFVMGCAWLWKWRRARRQFRCSNCDFLLRGERLYRDASGQSRCPKCGEEVVWDRGLKLYKD